MVPHGLVCLEASMVCSILRFTKKAVPDITMTIRMAELERPTKIVMVLLAEGFYLCGISCFRSVIMDLIWIVSTPSHVSDCGFW